MIDKIERVHEYFSRRVLFRTKLPYLTRLKVLKLEPLETRRIKFDLKLCYKIIDGLCDLNFDEFFTLASSSVTRGHNYELIKPLSKNNWLLNFYSSRVVSYWNSLPPDVVNASSFAIFVIKLNLVDLDKFCIVGQVFYAFRTCSAFLMSWTLILYQFQLALFYVFMSFISGIYKYMMCIRSCHVGKDWNKIK